MSGCEHARELVRKGSVIDVTYIDKGLYRGFSKPSLKLTVCMYFKSYLLRLMSIQMICYW